MKIGLLFSGHMRYFEDTAPSWYEHLLNHHEVDIFIHTWNVRGNQKPGYKIDDSESITEEQIRTVYPDAHITIEDYAETIKNVYTNYQKVSAVPVENIVNMYRKIQLCWEMIYDVYDYDLFIRARPDIKLLSPFPKNELADCREKLYVPDINEKGNQICDHLWFGGPYYFGISNVIYYYLDYYYADDIRSAGVVKSRGIRACPIHAETLLYHHAMTHNLPVHETKLRYDIPHKNWNRS